MAVAEWELAVTRSASGQFASDGECPVEGCGEAAGHGGGHAPADYGGMAKRLGHTKAGDWSEDWTAGGLWMRAAAAKAFGLKAQSGLSGWGGSDFPATAKDVALAKAVYADTQARLPAGKTMTLYRQIRPTLAHGGAGQARVEAAIKQIRTTKQYTPALGLESWTDDPELFAGLPDGVIVKAEVPREWVFAHHAHGADQLQGDIEVLVLGKGALPVKIVRAPKGSGRPDVHDLEEDVELAVTRNADGTFAQDGPCGEAGCGETEKHVHAYKKYESKKGTTAKVMPGRKRIAVTVTRDAPDALAGVITKVKHPASQWLVGMRVVLPEKNPDVVGGSRRSKRVKILVPPAKSFNPGTTGAAYTVQGPTGKVTVRAPSREKAERRGRAALGVKTVTTRKLRPGEVDKLAPTPGLLGPPPPLARPPARGALKHRITGKFRRPTLPRPTKPSLPEPPAVKSPLLKLPAKWSPGARMYAELELHDAGTVQVDLEEALGDALAALQDELDPAEVLRYEMTPHLTVKYGLQTADAEAVRQVVADSGPVDVELGGLGVFEHDEEDVLVITVVPTPSLVALRKRIEAALPWTETYPEYRPHVTVAYLQPGTAKAYLDDTRFLGRRFCITEVQFQPAEADGPVVQQLSEWELAVTRNKDGSFATDGDCPVQGCGETEQHVHSYRTYDDPKRSHVTVAKVVAPGTNLRVKVYVQDGLVIGADHPLAQALVGRKLVMPPGSVAIPVMGKAAAAGAAVAAGKAELPEWHDEPLTSAERTVQKAKGMTEREMLTHRHFGDLARQAKAYGAERRDVAANWEKAAPERKAWQEAYDGYKKQEEEIWDVRRAASDRAEAAMKAAQPDPKIKPLYSEIEKAVDKDPEFLKFIEKMDVAADRHRTAGIKALKAVYGDGDKVAQFTDLAGRSAGYLEAKWKSPGDTYKAKEWLSALPGDIARVEENRAYYDEPEAALKGLSTRIRRMDPESAVTKKLTADLLATNHDSHRHLNIKVLDVFEFTPPGADELRAVAKIGNMKRLFHGTQAGPALSIAANGFSKVKHVKTGAMLGEGIYMAENFSKSAQYVGGGFRERNKPGYVFVYDVAMGTVLNNGGKKTRGTMRLDQAKWAAGRAGTGEVGRFDSVKGMKSAGLQMYEYLFDANRVGEQAIPRYMVKVQLGGS